MTAPVTEPLVSAELLVSAEQEIEEVDAELDAVETKKAGCIPLRNVWLLMFYASDLSKLMNRGHVGIEERPDELPDLIAELLADAVQARLRRQLNAGYETRSANLTRVRGRIDMLTTERHQLLQRGEIHCRFDVLTINTRRNRYVLGALAMLAPLVKDRSLAQRCRTLARTMEEMGVGRNTPSARELSTERPGRNDDEDQLMLAAARLAFDLALPTESVGNQKLYRVDRDPHWLRRLFEAAVRGFYALTLPRHGWHVRNGGRTSRWPVTEPSTNLIALMPTMTTDIELNHRDSGRNIIIDTKYTSIVTSGNFARDRLKSGYLYQLYTYVMTRSIIDPSITRPTEGMLLHAAVGVDMLESGMIQGHPFTFATVDLAGASAAIGMRLLEVVDYGSSSLDSGRRNRKAP
jgi:5-methylcytosine-specific restriction enzyme subunit McrC